MSAFLPLAPSPFQCTTGVEDWAQNVRWPTAPAAVAAAATLNDTVPPPPPPAAPVTWTNAADAAGAGAGSGGSSYAAAPPAAFSVAGDGGADSGIDSAAAAAAAAAAALARINHYRAVHQAPPLSWDPSLAAAATAYAAGCPGPGAPSDGARAGAYGETLLFGARGLEAAIDAWYADLLQYDFANPGWTPAAGRFTQLVWASTARVGCAFSGDAGAGAGGLAAPCRWPVAACRYLAPGNVVGADWAAEVRPPVAKTPLTSAALANYGARRAPAAAPPRMLPPGAYGAAGYGAGAGAAGPLAGGGLGGDPLGDSLLGRLLGRNGGLGGGGLGGDGLGGAAPPPQTYYYPAGQGPARWLRSADADADGAAAAAVAPSSTAATADDAEVAAAFDLQNALRAAHGAPPLAWDAALAADAASFIAGCPMAHSRRWGDRGENLAWGFASFADGVRAWYAEVRRLADRQAG